MAKDLPYFKFFCSEWSDGDITLEDYQTQGLFINICAYYWSNECVLEVIKLKKRFRNEVEIVDLLLENNLLKQKDGFIKINFLDEQKLEREEQSKVRSKGGKASAEAKKLSKIQQTVNTTSTENQHVLKYCSTESQVLREDKIREEKKIEDNNIDSRKLKFAHTLKPFVDVYGKDVIRNFYDYWTEHGENDKKMRYEKEKSFGLNRRLTTWNNNNFKNNNNGKSTITNTDEFKQIVTAIKSDGVRR